MVCRLATLLFGGTPVRFESRLPVEEAVSRLSSEVKQWNLKTLFSETAIGVVTEERVMIRREIPFVRNDFKPRFVGSFERLGSGSILKGQFRLDTGTKVFMSFWLGFVALWTLLTCASVGLTSGSSAWLPLAGASMFVAGLLLIRIGKWFARNDRAWLSQRIAMALDAHLVESADQTAGDR